MKALLYSGGLDSVAALHLMPEVQPVYVRLGHKYEEQELATIARLAPTCRVYSGPVLGDLEATDGHIPHRNICLITTIAARGYDTIYIGALRGEASPDKQPAFLRSVGRALSHSEHRHVAVTAPFMGLTKTGLVKRALMAGCDPDLLLASRSCYAAGEPCNDCQACFRRWVALVNNDLPAERPRLPVTRDAVYHLKRAGVSRWPAVLRNNLDAANAIVRSYD